MGHLYNESILAETDPSGRLTAYEWRGLRYTVHGVLKSYDPAGGPDAATRTRIYRMRVSGDEGMAVAELVRGDDGWRLRHLFSA